MFAYLAVKTKFFPRLMRHEFVKQVREVFEAITNRTQRIFLSILKNISWEICNNNPSHNNSHVHLIIHLCRNLYVPLAIYPGHISYVYQVVNNTSGHNVAILSCTYLYSRGNPHGSMSSIFKSK